MIRTNGEACSKPELSLEQLCPGITSALEADEVSATGQPVLLEASRISG